MILSAANNVNVTAIELGRISRNDNIRVALLVFFLNVDVSFQRVWIFTRASNSFEYVTISHMNFYDTERGKLSRENSS